MIEIDGRGFIKGTNTMYEAKVVVLKRFSSDGIILLPGDEVVLKGSALAACLNLGKVRRYNPETDEEKKQPEVKSDQDKKSSSKKSKKK